MSELWVAHLGQVPYREAVALQEIVRKRRQAEEIPDSLLVLEHPPVYTKGRRTEPADLPMGEDWYRLQGIEVEPSDRGGRVTYHGPGQLVAYPIMRIADVPSYVRRIEQAMVAALADEGIEAGLREGLTASLIARLRAALPTGSGGPHCALAALPAAWTGRKPIAP